MSEALAYSCLPKRFALLLLSTPSRHYNTDGSSHRATSDVMFLALSTGIVMSQAETKERLVDLRHRQ